MSSIRREQTAFQWFALPVFVCGVVAGILVPAQTALAIPLLLGGAIFLLIKKEFVLAYTLCIGGVCGAVRASFPVSLTTYNILLFFKPMQSSISTALAQLVPQAPERALLYGLLLGGTGQFTPYWKEIFVATGTSHLVAVSGANVAYVVYVCELLLTRTTLSFVSRSLLMCVATGVYTALVGAPASAVRAALMSCMTAAAALCGRPSTAFHALAASCGLMLLWNPQVLFDIGFQLSCAATLGLIVTGSRGERIIISQAAQQTCAATIFTVPISVYHFSVVSFISLVTNVCVAPFVPVLTIASGVVLAVYALIPFIGELLSWPLVQITHVILRGLEWGASIPGSVATVSVGAWSLTVWCILLGFLVRRYVILRVCAIFKL